MNSCTIFSKSLDRKRAYDTLFQIVGDARLRAEGSPSAWTKLSISGPEPLHFTAKVWEAPMDEFSKLTLGAATFFRSIKTTAVKNRELVEDFVSRSELAIGVVAPGGFSEEERHFECIFGVAQVLDGMIFNGAAMLNDQGELILDSDGGYEITLNE